MERLIRKRDVNTIMEKMIELPLSFIVAESIFLATSAMRRKVAEKQRCGRDQNLINEPYYVEPVVRNFLFKPI